VRLEGIWWSAEDRPNDLTHDHRTRASREPMTSEQWLAEFVVVLRQARRRAGLSQQQLNALLLQSRLW
jgi:ribosome-binding protein aMBF1 (putative translation factor)